MGVPEKGDKCQPWWSSTFISTRVHVGLDASKEDLLDHGFVPLVCPFLGTIADGVVATLSSLSFHVHVEDGGVIALEVSGASCPRIASSSHSLWTLDKAKCWRQVELVSELATCDRKEAWGLFLMFALFLGMVQIGLDTHQE